MAAGLSSSHHCYRRHHTMPKWHHPVCSSVIGIKILCAYLAYSAPSGICTRKTYVHKYGTETQLSQSINRKHTGILTGRTPLLSCWIPLVTQVTQGADVSQLRASRASKMLSHKCTSVSDAQPYRWILKARSIESLTQICNGYVPLQLDTATAGYRCS